jgi:uncharacterized membrane protein
MKHAKKARFSPYQIFIGVLVKIPEIAKRAVVTLWEHITEGLMALAFIGMILAAQAFDNGTINSTIMALFILILIVLFLSLIKVKILESEKRGENK